MHQSQRWIHQPPTFVHTNVIYEEDGQKYIAAVEERFTKNNPITEQKLMQMSGREINIDSIWPAYDENLTVADNKAQELFLKTPNLIDIAFNDAEVMQRRILGEALFCEEIRKSPHPNVVDYRGCEVEDGRIKGILLKRYRETLYSRVNQSDKLDHDKLLAEIRRGIDHLHSLGIVHGDLQPANIMFDDDDNAIIIDLDSGRWIGDTIAAEDKKGSVFFTNKGVTLATQENDYYSIARIKDFLEGGMERLISG